MKPFVFSGFAHFGGFGNTPSFKLDPMFGQGLGFSDYKIFDYSYSYAFGDTYSKSGYSYEKAVGWPRYKDWRHKTYNSFDDDFSSSSESEQWSQSMALNHVYHHKFKPPHVRVSMFKGL